MKYTYLTTKQTSEMLSVSPWTLRRWVREGKGPECSRLPGKRDYRFFKEDVIRWMEKGKRK